MAGAELLLDVRVAPQWDVVAPLRLLALAVARPHVARHDDAEACAMVASELLENGVRYGDWRGNDVRQIHLSLGLEGGALVVTVASPVVGGSDDVAALQSHLARFAGLTSRKDAYEGRIREILESSGPPSRSRMGLARIVAEAGGDIHAQVDERSILRVTVLLRPEASP